LTSSGRHARIQLGKPVDDDHEAVFDVVFSSPLSVTSSVTPIKRPSGNASTLRRPVRGFGSLRPLRENGIGGLKVTVGVV